MTKRLLVACLALVAFAAFAPAASASPVLKEGGIQIAPGATVTAQSEGTIYRTDAVGNYICKESDMHGTVIKNNGSQIEIEFSAVTFGGGCGLSASKLPWCLRIGAEPTDSFTLYGGKCSEAPQPITVTVGCNYVSENAFTGSYSTGVLGVKLTTVVERFERESGLCRPFDVDPIKYNLSTAASPFTRLTIS